MLLVVADNYVQTKKDPEKIHAYSAKAVEIWPAKPKPEGVSDADWTARQNQIAGYAHYLNGKQYAIENKQAQADQEFRKALPHGGGDPGTGGDQTGDPLPPGALRLRAGEDAAPKGPGIGELLSRLRRAEKPVSGQGRGQSQGHHDGVSRNQVNLLIPNLGSTSLKYQVLEMPSETVLAQGRLERVGDYHRSHSSRSGPAERRSTPWR